MRQRFGAVPTAALVDVMDDLGLREQTLPPSIGALTAGMRLAGQAFTVEGRPSEHGDWDAAIRKTLAMLGARACGARRGLPVQSRPLRALRRALRDLARGARRRRLRDRRRLPRRPADRDARLPGLRPLRDPRGLDLALGGDGDRGADHDRHGRHRARATGSSATRTASSSFPPPAPRASSPRRRRRWGPRASSATRFVTGRRRSRRSSGTAPSRSRAPAGLAARGAERLEHDLDERVRREHVLAREDRAAAWALPAPIASRIARCWRSFFA